MKKISIIVPVYNVEKYLNKCIESLVAQTYKDLEIILVDDGSKDNCPQMCDEWAIEDNRIKVIHKANGGVSSARNAGLNVATGEYIQFVDSDDYLELNACEILAGEMYEKNVDLVVSDYYSHGFTRKKIIIQNFVEEDEETAFMQLYKNALFAFPWNKLYKKELIKNYFSNKLKYSEDFLFNCEYLANCKKISCINNCIYNYVAVKGSSVNSFSELCFPNQCFVANYIDDVLKNKYVKIISFLDEVKSDLLLSPFQYLVLTNQISKKEKKQYLDSFTKTKEFRNLNIKNMHFKRKILYYAIKFKNLKILKLLYRMNAKKYE